FIAAPCVALGLFTRPMALPLFVLMALSAYDHGKHDGWFWNKSGFEYPAVWAIGVLYFLINGGGLISLDHLLGFEFLGGPMADDLSPARHDLAVANRIVSYEGIIDAFGHVSMRHPTRPDRFLISRSRSPEVVEASDIYQYTLDSQPVTPLPQGIRGYGELVIH